MDYDTKNLKLKNIDVLSGFYKDFDNANITYLREIIDDDFSTLSNKLKLNFSKTYKLKEELNQIKKNIQSSQFDCLEKNEIDKDNVEKRNKNVNLLDYVPIVKLNFSNRSFHFLMANNVKFISQLMTLNENVLNAKGIGLLSYNEIIETKNRINNGELDSIIITFEGENPYLKKINYTIDKLNLSQYTYNELLNKNLQYIDDIINFSYDDFYTNKLLGKKSSIEIIAALTKFKEYLLNNDEDNLINLIFSYKDIIDAYVYKDKNYDFFDLNTLDFDLRIKLNLNDHITFSDLYNSVINNIASFSVNELKSINQFLQNNIPTNSVCNLNLNLNDEQLDIITKRAQGYTLEQIASIYNVTRERIRQKETKILNHIQMISNDLKLNNYMLENVYDESSITPISNDRYIKYFPILDCLIDVKKMIIDGKIYFVTKEYIQKCNKVLENLTEQIEEKGFVLINDIDLSFIDKRILPAMLNYFNINCNRIAYYLKGKSIDKIVSYIKHFGLIDLSDNNIDKIKEELEFYLDVKDFNKHNVVAKIGRYDVIPIGNGKYALSNKIPDIDKELLEDISKTIETENVISCNDLVLKYRNRLLPNISPSILYFKLKSAFGENFNYGGPNLTISIKTMSASKASIIYDYLKNSDDPVKVIDLMNKFKIDKILLSVIKSQNKDIFNIDDINWWLFSKMTYLDSLVDKMIKYINNKQSFFVTDMYRFMKDKYSDLLLLNKINSYERFYSILKLKCAESLNLFEYDRFKKRYIKIFTNKETGFDFEF